MKIIYLLTVLTAFLIMVSSVITLYSITDRTPVYINVAAMACLVVIVSILNFKKSKQNNK